MPYVPHTPEDRAEMLRVLGVETLDDLFRSIPESIRSRTPLKIPERRTESQILERFEELQARNRRMDDRPSFLGAGSYRRFLPVAIDYLAGRGEFSTAYTPYQPEVSQGTLQAIFEYQTMMCRLTGMEISNASLYEGGTALAEAVLMAYSVRGKGSRVVVSEGVHPEYRRVLETYMRDYPVECTFVPLSDGCTTTAALEEVIDDDTLAIVIQNPNFLGFIEDGGAVNRLVKSRGGGKPPFLIAVADPISLGLLIPPGEYGADIAVGDGQQLGNYPTYGGPTFGFFATRRGHVRKVPGRIVGETRDRDGRKGYVLTFQTREQHIRRERATSNICTNQGLCSLRAAMYLTLLGEDGIREVAVTSTRKAHYAHERLLTVPGIRSVASAAFFHEFPIELPVSAEVVYEELDRRGIGGGLPLGRYDPDRERQMLLAFTEMTPTRHVEQLVEALTVILSEVILSEVILSEVILSEVKSSEGTASQAPPRNVPARNDIRSPA